MTVLVVHGPNLNLLGTCELAIYGNATLEDVNAVIEATAKELDVNVEIHQTQREGEIIELLHSGIGRVQGALLNPAAYSHTSRAIADAVRGFRSPSSKSTYRTFMREPWRRESVTAEAAKGLVAGFGPQSYAAALRALVATEEG